MSNWHYFFDSYESMANKVINCLSNDCKVDFSKMHKKVMILQLTYQVDIKVCSRNFHRRISMLYVIQSHWLPTSSTFFCCCATSTCFLFSLSWIHSTKTSWILSGKHKWRLLWPQLTVIIQLLVHLLISRIWQWKTWYKKRSLRSSGEKGRIKSLC